MPAPPVDVKLGHQAEIWFESGEFTTRIDGHELYRSDINAFYNTAA